MLWGLLFLGLLGIFIFIGKDYWRECGGSGGVCRNFSDFLARGGNWKMAILYLAPTGRRRWWGARVLTDGYW